jgi:VCBS repeat-containing protein
VTLNEANLALGSAPNNGALTQSGSFVVNSTGGLYNLSIAGKVVLSNGTLVNYGAPITTESGNTLRITGLNASNGVVTYTYTLVANENHPAGLGANQLTENLAVVASDRNADSSHLTLTGNVLSNDTQGADRIANGPISAGTLAGKYGSLLLNADGSYTYTLNTGSAGYTGLGPNGRGSESFTYTLKDADGDSATAQLSINVTGPAPTGSASIVGIGSAAGDVTLNEANLALGSAPSNSALTQSGTFTVNSTGGLYNLSIAGKVVLSNGTLVNYGAPITTDSGNTLRITGLNASNGVVTYTYTLNASESHPSGLGANQLTENLAVIASDRNGASASSSIVVKVTDDLPRAVNDSNANTADSGHLTLNGNVLSNDTQGADRVSGGPVVGGTFTGTYGTLVLGANGAYTYTLNTNDADFKALATGQLANETFNYSLRDADGDTSTAQLQLQIGGGAGNVVTFMRLAAPKAPRQRRPVTLPRAPCRPSPSTVPARSWALR